MLDTRENILSGTKAFSILLDYPRSTKQIRDHLNGILSLGLNKVNEHLKKFDEFLKEETTQISNLEEMYTSNFDLNPSYHLYIGYHLYGDSYKRSKFLIKLKEKYRKDDYVIPDGELSDYLPIMLDYLTICPEEPRDYLINEIIVPVLEKVLLDKPLSINIPLQSELRGMDKDLKTFEPVKNSSNNPYVSILHGLLKYLYHLQGGNN